jgi:hypothetical protein
LLIQEKKSNYHKSHTWAVSSLLVKASSSTEGKSGLNRNKCTSILSIAMHIRACSQLQLAGVRLHKFACVHHYPPTN